MQLIAAAIQLELLYDIINVISDFNKQLRMHTYVHLQ